MKYTILAALIAGIAIITTVTTAEAGQTHDGWWLVYPEHPDVFESATFWTEYEEDGETKTKNTETIQPLIIGGMAIFNYPHPVDTKDEQLWYKYTYYDLYHDLKMTPTEQVDNTNYHWLQPVAEIHAQVQALFMQNHDQNERLEALESKLAQQTKKIQKLEEKLNPETKATNNTSHCPKHE